MKKYAVLCLMVLLLGTAFLGTSKADGGTTTENGFTWDENGVLTSYAYNGSNNVVVIPSNITAIGFNAFAGKSITEVTIPASVTSIDQQAFISCSQLKKVTFSDISESKLTTIGDRAFLGCASLESLTFPSSVTDMGATVFQGCASLKSVSFPKNLKSFDINSYRNCTALTEVIIPDCVTVITEYCFDQCSSLVSLNIPDSVTTIEPFALCGSRIPALEKVTIGTGVTKIGGNAFYGCSNLTSVTFAMPGADCTLGENCFSGCSALSSITLPGRVTSIGVDCFNYDSSLASVTLGEGLKNIGSQAFYYASSLKEITIPKTVTSIGYSAFTRCDSLEKVVLEEGVTGFYEYSFSYCNALKEINIPGSIKKVGSNMFSSCPILQKVTLGEGVESIGDGAFSNCFKLNNVVLPSTLTEFNSNAFYGCDKVEGFTVTSGEGSFCGTKDGKALMDGSTLVWLASDTTPIPASVDTIGKSVFYKHVQLKNLILPNNIKYIADSAFEQCYQLETVVLPTELIGIGASAFWGCSKLDHITIPATVSEIGEKAFSSCASLRDFSVSKANPYYSFESKALVDLRNGTLLWGDLATEIPSNVRIIAAEAFDATDTHKALLLPDGLLTICEKAFYCCKKLETVAIPDTVTSIAGNAFFICSNLQYVSIPEGVTKLNQEIFSYCSNLECVAFPKNDIEIKSCYKNECNEQNFRMMVYPNTAAEQYAKENNCKYEYYYNGGAKVSFTGNLLSLEESYILYVYTDYAEGNTTIPNGISARVTYPDGKMTSNILPTKKENLKRNDPASGTVYPFGIPFAAKEINDEVIVQIFQNGTDIPLSDPITVSVAKYCNDLCRLDTATEEQKNLVQKLLTYATYSQLYFGYNTDKLAKPIADCSLSDTADVIAALSNCPEEPGFIGKKRYVDSLYVFGTSMILDSTIVYRVYLLTDYSDTPSHCGLESVSTEIDVYYKDIPVPLITQLGDDMNVQMNDVYVVGKPIAYIKATLSKTTDESLKNICIALYDYYMAAKAYQQ